MSTPSIPDATAPNGANKYSFRTINDMKPIGRPIPPIPASLYHDLQITSKIIPSAPQNALTAEKAKTRTGFFKFMESIRSASPAIVARRNAEKQPLGGKYYATGPDGEVIETTIGRKQPLEMTWDD